MREGTELEASSRRHPSFNWQQRESDSMGAIPNLYLTSHSTYNICFQIRHVDASEDSICNLETEYMRRVDSQR